MNIASTLALTGSLRKQLTLLLIACSPATADTLLSWDLPANSIASSSGAAPTPALGVSGSVITAATPGTSSASVTAEATYWNRRGFDTTSFEDAQAAGDYYSFTTTAADGYNLSITGIGSSVMRIGSAGPTTVGLFYSPDNVTFAQVGASATLSSSADVNLGTAFSTGMTPINLSSGEIGFWRVVGFGSTGTTNASRLRWLATTAADFSLTGTSTPLAVPANLVWNGVNNGNWNLEASNLNWADSGNGNAPSAFEPNDNVTIGQAHTINVDLFGITAGTVTVNSESGTTTLTGGSLSAFSLSKSNGGNLLLDGFNLFSAPIVVTGGTLTAGFDSALGVNAVNIDGGTLSNTPAATILTNPLSIGTAGATLLTPTDLAMSGAVSTFGAAANASNSLVKSGAGLLVLSGSTLGSQMTFNSTGGAVDFDITAGSVRFSGSGTRNLGGTSTWDGPVTLAGGTLRMHGNLVEGLGLVSVQENSTIISRLNFSNAFMNSAITVDATRTLTLSSENGTNMLLVNGTISGDGALAKAGNGTVRVNGINTFAGGTTLGTATATSGALQVGSDSALGTGPITFHGGTTLAAYNGAKTLANAVTALGDFTLGGASAAIVINGAVDLSGAARVITLANSATLGGAISNGGITVASTSAARSLTLSGTNSYQGETLVNAGILRIQGDSSAATGSLIISSGASLGGNGVSGAALTLAEGSSLVPEIRDWLGAAGVGYDDLQVASFDAAELPFTVTVSTAALVNFSETNASFVILKTTGGITNFNPASVTINTPGFTGTGSWSLAKVGNNLVLSYSAGSADPYQAWATGAPYNLSGGNALQDADPDQDGIANVLEFVIGGNPANAANQSLLPTAVRDGDAFVVSFRRTSDSAYLNPAVQYSTTLTGAWTTAQHGVNDVSIVTTENGFGTGVDRVEVRLPASVASGQKLFARLKAPLP